VEYRQRRLVAAGVLALSVLIVVYLIFFTPSESNIATPTPTTATSSSALWTALSSSAERDHKRIAGVSLAALALTPGAAERDRQSEQRSMVEMPQWMSQIESTPEHANCPDRAERTVEVSNSGELTNALESAQAGDRISLSAGRYEGNFELVASGEPEKRIWICGPRAAVIDSGGSKNGYGLHITGSHAGVWGLTVSNAQKGIMIDGGDFVHIDSVGVHTIGDEAIHFRGNATDGVVQGSLIHHTGLRRDKFGEGIYVGSAVSNWGKITNGDPDKSDRIAILRNRIWDTTAESIDLKEGTTEGRVELNAFDGSSLTGADSWVDAKGNDYVLQGNVGMTSPEDGFQTHNIDDMGWGQNNQFVANTAQVEGPGYGFYIHDADKTNNQVSCSNIVSNAESGFSNKECTDLP